MTDTKKNGAFSVVFDYQGNPIDIIPGPGCVLIAEEEATTENLERILKKLREERKEEHVSTVGCHLLSVHSSPGCYILTAGGKLKCICCG